MQHRTLWLSKQARVADCLFPAGAFVVPRALVGTETGSQRSQESLSLLGVFLGAQAGRQISSFHMK